MKKIFQECKTCDYAGEVTDLFLQIQKMYTFIIQ